MFEDYEQAIQLWSGIEGIGLNESDTPEAIQAFLERNPGFSAVATAESGKVVGTILCGHNGRAGSIQHLAVVPEYRRQGIARQLLEYAYTHLASAKIPRCNIFVYNDNQHGNHFWLNNGWVDPTTWRVLQKRITPECESGGC
ncbi:GNAT family N-acetyltransferase [Acidihalobacter prosperus]|uniref:GNAT family N-acetyltransferase n=1 Tax=Acidihalobacter prosperus TaxID=160660 RepID=UPI0013733E7C|nr:N-acetyltransferase [Acidihalobacter prosperus]